KVRQRRQRARRDREVLDAELAEPRRQRVELLEAESADPALPQIRDVADLLRPRDRDVILHVGHRGTERQRYGPVRWCSPAQYAASSIAAPRRSQSSDAPSNVISTS